MKLLHRFDHICAHVERAAAVVLFSALTLLLFGNIVLRSLFGVSFQRILELVPAIVLWLALIGASLALQQGRHIKIELLLRFCTRPTQRIARRISGAFGMAVMGLLFFASLEFLQNEIAIFGPVGVLSAILPVFFCVSFSRFLIATIDPDGAPRFDPTPLADDDRPQGLLP
jgi:TRAP-type C4-dicarboxylate transport system permease small subunit